MYPTLSDLLRDVFNINIPLPIQSFGLMMGFAFLFAAWSLSLELKRKEREGLLVSTVQKKLTGAPATPGELISSGIFGFLLGFKLVYIVLNYTEFVNDTQGVLLSSKGNVLAGLAFAALSSYLRYSEKEKQKTTPPVVEEQPVRPHEHVWNITMISAISGLLGAKIFHNLENIDELLEDPIDALLSFSGLTMYGGLIFGAVAVLWYARKNNISWRHLTDAVAPGLMLAYGVGRLGCQISGDGDWGIVNNKPKPAFLNFLPDWSWAYNYPHNVNNVGISIPGCTGRHCMMLPQNVYPTPLWEALICILLFFVLWSLRKQITIPGMLFSLYLLLNGIERFFIEKIRVNTEYHISGYGITQAEIISFVLVILGITGIFYFRKKKKYWTEGL